MRTVFDHLLINYNRWQLDARIHSQCVHLSSNQFKRTRPLYDTLTNIFTFDKIVAAMGWRSSHRADVAHVELYRTLVRCRGSQLDVAIELKEMCV